MTSSAPVARARRLLLRAGRADDVRPRPPRHLHQQQPDATRRRVDQATIARPQRKGRVRQVVRGHALQHERRGHVQPDAGRHRHQPVRQHHGVLCICAHRAGVGDAVADGDAAHVAPHGDDGARRFLAERRRQRDRVNPLPLVDVDEVHARRRHLDQRLARARLRVRHLLVAQHLRSTRLVDPHRMHGLWRHPSPPRSRSRSNSRPATALGASRPPRRASAAEPTPSAPPAAGPYRPTGHAHNRARPACAQPGARGCCGFTDVAEGSSRPWSFAGCPRSRRASGIGRRVPGLCRIAGAEELCPALLHSPVDRMQRGRGDSAPTQRTALGDRHEQVHVSVPGQR